MRPERSQHLTDRSGSSWRQYSISMCNVALYFDILPYEMTISRFDLIQFDILPLTQALIMFVMRV